MISSTSSSEAVNAKAWRKWLVTCGAVFVTALAVTWFSLLLLDPYDSGRFPGLRVSGVVDRNPRTANAGRGRSALFDAALFGNSTGQLLDPVRLSAATSLNFVQLTVPGTGPREQMTLLRYFISQHKHTAALVMVTDPSWCTPDPVPVLDHPFPFWLYGSNFEYLRHFASWHALELGFRRVGLALRLRQPVARDDGFLDYEIGWAWSFHPPPRAPAVAADDTATAASSEPSFPAIAQLGNIFRGLPSDVAVVVVVPPLYSDDLPAPQSSSGIRMAQCKSALDKAVAQRRRSGFLDFRVENAMTRDPQNFMNAMHYRAALARQMEQSVSAAITAEAAKGRS
jgi:hypothetical protein